MERKNDGLNGRWRNDLLTQLVSLLGSNKSSRWHCEPEYIARREMYEFQVFRVREGYKEFTVAYTLQHNLP